MPSKKCNTQIWDCDKEYLSFVSCHAATALTKTAAEFHAPTQLRLRLNTRRVSKWRMLKRKIWKMRG